MPVYVYRNLKTGETFELEQHITEAALTAHPETGEPVKRLIQPVSIAFKGSGFYVNDSRKSSSSNSNHSKNDGKKDGDGGKKDASADKSDKKAEKKSEKAESTQASSSVQ